MNFWEELIIHLALGVVQATVRNPAKAAAVRERLLELADDIYTGYGLTPPAHN